MPGSAIRRASLSLIVLAVVSAVSVVGQTPAPPLHRLDGMLQDLVARVDPAVVQVMTNSLGFSAEGNGALLRTERGTGSGILVDPAGYIVTNAHVVGVARRVKVLLPEMVDEKIKFQSVVKPSGKVFPANVIGLDRETDIAVLKIEGSDFPHLEFEDSETIRQGQLAVAFGSPYGLENSVTMGIVSNVARQVRPDDRMIYIQTDAAINPGNSGGPLVNPAGKVMGINTFIISPSGANDGIGFAIPANIARTVYEQIRRDGRVRRGQIGVVAQTISHDLAEALTLPQSWGVILSDIVPDGAAEAAGLAVKDIVLTLDGRVMENSRQFGVNIYQHAGETVTLEILRDGQRLTKRVAVLERPRDPDRVLTLVEGEENVIARLGILALDLDERVLPLLPSVRRLNGVVVAGVIANFSTEDSPLQGGDVIYEFNTQKIVDVAGLRAAAAGHEHGKPVALQIERAGQLQYILMDLP